MNVCDCLIATSFSLAPGFDQESYRLQHSICTRAGQEQTASTFVLFAPLFLTDASATAPLLFWMLKKNRSTLRHSLASSVTFCRMISPRF